MHGTAKRLFEIGKEAGAKDFTEVAKWLGGSDQSATNWKSRGIPKQVIIDAAKMFSASVAYIESGKLPKYLNTIEGESRRVDVLTKTNSVFVLTDPPKTGMEELISLAEQLDTLRMGMLIGKARDLVAEQPAKQTLPSTG